jgi:hypothetical protein
MSKSTQPKGTLKLVTNANVLWQTRGARKRADDTGFLMKKYEFIKIWLMCHVVQLKDKESIRASCGGQSLCPTLARRTSLRRLSHMQVIYCDCR